MFQAQEPLKQNWSAGAASSGLSPLLGSHRLPRGCSSSHPSSGACPLGRALRCGPPSRARVTVAEFSGITRPEGLCTRACGQRHRQRWAGRGCVGWNSKGRPGRSPAAPSVTGWDQWPAPRGARALKAAAAPHFDAVSVLHLFICKLPRYAGEGSVTERDFTNFISLLIGCAEPLHANLVLLKFLTAARYCGGIVYALNNR